MTPLNTFAEFLYGQGGPCEPEGNQFKEWPERLRSETVMTPSRCPRPEASGAGLA